MRIRVGDASLRQDDLSVVGAVFAMFARDAWLPSTNPSDQKFISEPGQMTIPTERTTPLLTLAMAHEAAQRGDRQLAHRICVRLLAADPGNVSAWLLRAESTDSQEEMVAALGRVLTMNPAQPEARRKLYEAMQGLLRQDASLGYVGETSSLYDARTSSGLEIIQPKDRAVGEPFPPPVPPPAQAVHRWMGWSLIGLIPAGVGTLFSAPAASVAAIRLLRRRPSEADRRRALITLSLAPVLWLLAVLFVLALVIHLV